jgi:hypothetical protein
MEELGRDNNDKAGLIPREEQGQPGMSNYWSLHFWESE